MSDNKEIGQIVAQVVSQVLESNILRIREELIGRVLEALPVEHPSAPAQAAGPDHLPQLLKSITAIHSVAAQRDVLRALLDNSLQFCGRAALFVVKGTSVNGWQGRAFVDNDAVKDMALDANSGLVGRALQTHKAVVGSPEEMDRNFMTRFGGPVDGRCLLLPLVLKEKVAALIYADCGLEGGVALNAEALEVLVLATGTWLEVALVRKSGAKESVPEASAAAAAAGAGAPSSAATDPFAAHAPRHAMASTASATADSPAHESGSSEGDVHKKAQRFARLLVDEIKLYNQAKVMEGRKNKDLYDRMKEDIDKSRATYQKRYGNTAAASADYFSQELIRSLAEDDVLLLGSNFKR
jgi:hypothetical protein